MEMHADEVRYHREKRFEEEYPAHHEDIQGNGMAAGYPASRRCEVLAAAYRATISKLSTREFFAALVAIR